MNSRADWTPSPSKSPPDKYASFDKAAAFQRLIEVGINYEVIVVRGTLGLFQKRKTAGHMILELWKHPIVNNYRPGKRLSRN